VTIDETEPPRYGLSSAWEHERRRLALLEEVWDPFTIATLDAVGAVTPGARCLELGGGGGTIAAWLCDRVGPTGSVTATDLDTRWLDALDHPNLTVLRHDLLVDDLPAAGFDVIHARAVLEHIADRERAVDRIVGWLAPGGRLVLDDCATFSIEASPHPVYLRAMHGWVAVLARTGTDYTWARTFPAPLVRAGLVDVGATVDVPTLRGGTPVAEFWSLTLEFLRPRMVALGVCTDADIAEARSLLADPGFWDLSPAFVSTWGHRPT
jgi:SAM-dependent methyltransferase